MMRAMTIYACQPYKGNIKYKNSYTTPYVQFFCFMQIHVSISIQAGGNDACSLCPIRRDVRALASALRWVTFDI